jgi:hypothetical protein
MVLNVYGNNSFCIFQLIILLPFFKWPHTNLHSCSVNLGFHVYLTIEA